jgi:hypothetical protein
MARYEVTIDYQTTTMIVQAQTMDRALQIALDSAPEAKIEGVSTAQWGI